MGIKEQLAAQSKPLSREETLLLFTRTEEEFVKLPLEFLEEISAYNLLVDLRDAALTPEQEPVIKKNICFKYNIFHPKTLIKRIVEYGAESHLSPQDMARWKFFGLTIDSEAEFLDILIRKYRFDSYRIEPEELSQHVKISYSLAWRGNCDYKIEIYAEHCDNGGHDLSVRVTGEEGNKRKASKDLKGNGTRSLPEREQIVALIYLQTIATDTEEEGSVPAKRATPVRSVITTAAVPSPNPDWQLLSQKLAAAETVSKLSEIEDLLRRR